MSTRATSGARLRALLGVSFLAAGSGCYSHVWASDVVRERTARELKCPVDEVAVQDLGEKKYRAVGCGRKRTYVCTHQYVSDIAAHTLFCDEDALAE